MLTFTYDHLPFAGHKHPAHLRTRLLLPPRRTLTFTTFIASVVTAPANEDQDPQDLINL